ncbi:hypothetical protein Cgig2_030885 [Carnegiea gigantea]|uniref:Uncharacterized protein n=1 Tax=Carnegiea gigantea TaxID=171969 RepID=A0A9Q1KI16_9CARY|nr:hypothetical protein Cgig2_030885 [Carnegiea gigantea]
MAISHRFLLLSRIVQEFWEIAKWLASSDLHAWIRRIVAVEIQFCKLSDDLWVTDCSSFHLGLIVRNEWPKSLVVALCISLSNLSTTALVCFNFVINTPALSNGNPFLRLISLSSACIMHPTNVAEYGAVFCKHCGVKTYDAIFILRQVKEPILRSLKPQKSPAVQKDRSVLLLTRVLWRERGFLGGRTFRSHFVNRDRFSTIGSLGEVGDTTVSCQKKLLGHYLSFLWDDKIRTAIGTRATRTQALGVTNYDIMSKPGFYEVNFYYEVGPTFPLKWVHVVFKKVIDSCCWEPRIFFKHDLQPYDLLSALKQQEIPQDFMLKSSALSSMFCCLILVLQSSEESLLPRYMSPIVGSSKKLANEMCSGQLRFRKLDQLLGYIDLLNSGWVPVLTGREKYLRTEVFCINEAKYRAR